jgi:hypothetical protein
MAEQMMDYQLDTLVLKEPVLLFFTDGVKPLTRLVANMEEVTDLMSEIQDNGWLPGVGPMTIQLQLWFALARHAGMFKATD